MALEASVLKQNLVDENKNGGNRKALGTKDHTYTWGKFVTIKVPKYSWGELWIILSYNPTTH